jgi:hypothetical protein
MHAIWPLTTSLSLGIASFAIAAEPQGETLEIPLKDIWALDMPGTRDINELAPRKATEDTAVSRITRKLISCSPKEVAGKCFIVAGVDAAALSAADEVLCGGRPPLKSVPANKDVTLVFYNIPAPGYVHLKSVDHSDADGRVTVTYEVVKHIQANVTVHLALIPLGKLPPGKLSVEITQFTNIEREDSARAVCKPDTFQILEMSGDKKP